MRIWVQSLASPSGLWIWHCHELWCRLQKQFGSCIAVPVAQPCSRISDSAPSLGSSICQRCGPKKQKRKKENLEENKTEKVVGGEDGPGVSDWNMHNEVYGMVGEWGPAVQHRVLYPAFCDNLCGKRIWERMDTCVCMTGSLYCIAEIIKTL